MASTTRQPISEWSTFHNNGPYPAKLMYKTFLEEEGILPSEVDRYNDAAKEIQLLLQETLNSGEGFRALGSRWSLSNIAHHKDRMHFNRNMNIKMIVQSNEIHPGSSFSPSNLFFFQCGNSIKEISNFIFKYGRSIKASGASNGQTIAGAISTGIHGSALDVGSFQDSVVGINLIIGPDINDNVYLERNTQPALTDEFASRLNTRVIRNDGLFNSALVGLGAFGFIHGVVLETENLFLLNRYVKKMNKQKALELAQTLNFKDSDFTIPTEVDADGKGNRPFHFKIFINPYNNAEDYIVELMYKKKYKPGYPDPFPRIKTALYKDLIVLFAKIAENHQNNIPGLIKLLEKEILPKTDNDVTGTLAEIFWDATNQGAAFACSVGIDHTDSPKALQLLTELARNEGPIPGIYAMRFVKASAATLAFSKFPVTCMLEIDGVLWKGNDKIISLENFCIRIIEVLKESGIDFTLHWGKNAAWSFPGLVNSMYGDRAIKWKEYRSALLREEMANLFSNDFLETAKLSDYVHDVSPDLIKSID